MTEDELIVDIAGFEHDPLGYVEYAMDWPEEKGVREWQKEELTAIGEHLANPRTQYTPYQKAISSGHGIGKSAFFAWVNIWGLSTKAGTKGVTTANTKGQLMTKTWPEVEKWHKKAINAHWFKWDKTSLYVRDDPSNWRVDAITWDLRNPEAFAGLHNEGKRILLLMDEGSAIPKKIFEVSEGALTDEGTEIIWLVFGNPTRNVGSFRECFRKDREFWETRKIDSRDVEGTNKDQLKKIEQQYGEDSDEMKIRVRGEFPDQSVMQLISQKVVEEAAIRILEATSYDFAPVILGVDPAWDGGDKTVIFLRQGLHSEILREMQKNDNDGDVANIIAELEDEHQADSVNIDFGFGTGIYSFGKTMGRNWKLVRFGAGGERGCRNKRAEIWRKMKGWLSEGGSIPNHDALKTDLISMEKKATMDGSLLLKSKEEMKKDGLPSPDYADALACTFAFNVKKKKKRIAPMGRSGWMD